MLERNILHRPRSQIYRGKTSEISQAWSCTFLNLRHNSEHVDAVISGTGRPQENRIFRLLNIHNIHNKIAFYSNRKIFSQMFIAWNVGSDGKIKIIDDMGTLIGKTSSSV